MLSRLLLFVGLLFLSAPLHANTYYYSSDSDIVAKQKELRQLKKVAEAIGTLESKQSPDSWRIKDLEAE